MITKHSEWPFEDAKNTAVLTTSKVVYEKELISYVTHDDDDGMWQFLSASGASYDTALVVGLESMIQHDKSLIELADLPYGWCAWRDSQEAGWRRAPREKQKDD